MSDDIGAIRRYLEANVGDLGFRYTLQQHLDRLETELNLRQASQNDYQAEVKGLREAETICLKYHNARNRIMQKNLRLEAEVKKLREENKTLAAAAITAEGPSYAFMQDEVKKLREMLGMKGQEFLDDIEQLRNEVKRLREENKQLLLTKAGAFEVQMEYAAENERLRTEITGLREDDEAKQAEVERLRGLNDAGEPWHYSQHLGDQPLEAKDE